MKRYFFISILAGLILVCLTLSAAAGGVYGTAVVDGKSADRVHLRAYPSLGAASLGLYFTGTQVQCNSNPYAAWVNITIGSQSGYMKADFLAAGTQAAAIVPQQPLATVKTVYPGSWVNLRQEPSLQSGVQGRVQDGDTVTMLGETADHWAYVASGNQKGYMLAKYLLVGSAAAPPAAQKNYLMLSYNPATSISIQYPFFTAAGNDMLNALILSQVLQMIPAPTQQNGRTIDYQAAITLNNDKMISIVFWGYSNVEGSIHPFSDLFALNIDLATLQRITLADLYLTNTAFESVFFENAHFPSAPITSYNAQMFPDMLQMQAPEHLGTSVFQSYSQISCFLKPDGLVISLPSLHATGSDHFEAQIPYSAIQPFYRLSTRYWEN